MDAVVVDSLSLKIQSFLKNTGFDYDDSVSSATQLMAYFENEYGLQMMGFLEQEWVDEQIERDMQEGYFRQLRAYVSQDQLANFDEAVASIWDD